MQGFNGPNNLSFPSGGFLSDAGWYGDAEKVFLSCLQLCTLHDEVLHWYRAVECCVRWDLLCCCFSQVHMLNHFKSEANNLELFIYLISYIQCIETKRYQTFSTLWIIWWWQKPQIKYTHWTTKAAFFKTHFLINFPLYQVASCPQWQLQVPPGRRDVQTGPVLHGQTCQTRPSGQ